MNTKTLEALKASIAHWEANKSAETPDGVKLGTGDCALCQLFYEKHCTGCPVAEKAGYTGCYGTPYHAAGFAQDAWMHHPTPDARAAFRAAAQDEIDFLRSLLPEGEA